MPAYQMDARGCLIRFCIPLIQSNDLSMKDRVKDSRWLRLIDLPIPNDESALVHRMFGDMTTITSCSQTNPKCQVDFEADQTINGRCYASNVHSLVSTVFQPQVSSYFPLIAHISSFFMPSYPLSQLCFTILRLVCFDIGNDR